MLIQEIAWQSESRKTDELVGKWQAGIDRVREAIETTRTLTRDYRHRRLIVPVLNCKVAPKETTQG
jgi:hypothetical protein